MYNRSVGVTGLFTGSGVGNMMIRRIFPVLTLLILLLGFLRLQAHRLNLVSVEFGIALFAISFLLVGLIIIGISALQLNKIDIKRIQAEDSLKELNRNL
jgi:hypothetical protein